MECRVQIADYIACGSQFGLADTKTEENPGSILEHSDIRKSVGHITLVRKEKHEKRIANQNK